MKKKKINYLKILANAGEVFFVTLGGIATTNAIFKIDIPLEAFLVMASIPALIQAGINFCHEVGKAAEESDAPNKLGVIKTQIAKVNWKKRLHVATGYFGVFN